MKGLTNGEDLQSAAQDKTVFSSQKKEEHSRRRDQVTLKQASTMKDLHSKNDISPVPLNQGTKGKELHSKNDTSEMYINGADNGSVESYISDKLEPYRARSNSSSL